MTLSVYDGPPLPESPAEQRRVEHQRLARRIMYGIHQPDVERRLAEQFGPIRSGVMVPDMSRNPMVSTYSGLAGLYRDLPLVRPPDGGEGTAAALQEAGAWSLMPRVQRDTLGLRNGFVRVDPVGGELAIRPAFPDMLEVETDPLGRPIVVREWVRFRGSWVQEIVDIADPEAPLHLVVDERGRDVTGDVLGGEYVDAGAFHWRGLTTGRPVMPYIAYRAANAGPAIWGDVYTGLEVVETVLQISVLYTYWAHIIRNAAFAQRYSIGLIPAGLEEKASRNEVITDPSTLLLLKPIPGLADGQQGMVGQFQQAADPMAVIESIRVYERAAVDQALGAAQVSRATSDIRSGYSLAVSREEKREAQRAYRPLFERSDLMLLRTVADLRGEPVDGWGIEYQGLPKSAEEERKETEAIVAKVQAGLMSQVDAYQRLHPGVSEQDAIEALISINRANARLTPAARSGE